jgi:hypothetical protein
LSLVRRKGGLELGDDRFELIALEEEPIRVLPFGPLKHTGNRVCSFKNLQFERARLAVSWGHLDAEDALNNANASLDCALVATAHLGKPRDARIAGARFVVHVEADREGDRFRVRVYTSIPNETLEIVRAELECGAIHWCLHRNESA